MQVPTRLINVRTARNRGREETVIRGRLRVFLSELKHSDEKRGERNDCANDFIKVLVPVKHTRTLEHSVTGVKGVPALMLPGLSKLWLWLLCRISLRLAALPQQHYYRP